jgi:hypothetical protein
MAEKLLFDQLFIEYIQAFFFKHPNQSFSQDAITQSMPDFYRDISMVQGALHILLLRGMIRPVPLMPDESGRSFDQWIADEGAMEKVRKVREAEDLNREIDIEIKQRTKDQMKWQRWPMKYWYVVAFSGIILTAAATKIFESPKTPESPSLSAPAIRALIDSSLSHRIHP